MIEKLMRAVKRVCDFQKSKFFPDIRFDAKEHRLDSVSEVDLESQRILLEAIDEEFPQAGVIAEEEGGDKQPGSEQIVSL